MAAETLVPGDGVFPPAQGVLPDLPAAVSPGNLLFVSGWVDPDLEIHTDVQSQTVGALKSLQAFLESQELTLVDGVLMHAYIGSEADRHGYVAGYAEVFGPDRSAKPAHCLLHVVRPAATPGALVEIDLVALRPASPSHD